MTGNLIPARSSPIMGVLQIMTKERMPVAYRKSVSISLPPQLEREVLRTARRRNQTTSEFVRAALTQYIEDQKTREVLWKRARRYSAKKAKELGIRTEEDVYRIMNELRHGRASRFYAASSRR